MIKKYSIYIVLALIITAKGHAQDPQFSQFYAAPLYLGPSFAGATEGTRLGINFRDQWPGIPGKFVTYAFSADHYIEEYKSGVGLLVMQDAAGGGKLTYTSFTGQYAFNIKVNNTLRIRPGAQFAYAIRNINMNSLNFGSEYNESGEQVREASEQIEKQPGHFDFGTSVLIHGRKFWSGVTIDHLVKANPAFSDNENYSPIKYTIFAGGNIALEKSFYKRDKNNLLVAFHFKSQGKSQQLDFGTYYQKNAIMVGAWYRGIPVFGGGNSHDAVTLLAGYNISGISIGYSYDLTISRLMMKTGGAHEISLTYLLGQQTWKKKKKVEPVPCPIL